jgi:uncharacterized iron-regulated membrane protein
VKLPTDLIKMYKEIHGWVGIISGLALFIAFFAGALTMFEDHIQRWASPPSALAAPPPLEKTPELVAKVLAAHPEAKEGYTVHLVTDSARPARVSWDVRPGEDDHAPPVTYYASLAPEGSLQVETKGPSPVAQFIDVLHQQVGLPFEHEVAMPIMGAIAMLYFVAIVSGLVVLLPSLVSDLFAMRLGKNVKRMWLDAHNLLGIFSLPFHIIMALTALVFAFHDQFYGAQGLAFGGAERERPAAVAQGEAPPMLTPVQMVERLRQQAPDFTPMVLDISERRDGSRNVRVGGLSERHAVRGPTMGYGAIDPVTGELTGKDYMPGHQDGWSAAVTSFFTLHFGAFGGEPIRWSYFLLGLAGAFIFYTGNLLWIESRRKRERKAGAVEQTRATRVLGALTVGVPTGTIAGIAITLAAAKPLGAGATEGLHSMIFYTVFLAFVAWAMVRGAARSGYELAFAAAIAMVAVPLSSLAFMSRHPVSIIGVDAIALLLCGGLFMAGRAAQKRAAATPRDSVWFSSRAVAEGYPA